MPACVMGIAASCLGLYTILRAQLHRRHAVWSFAGLLAVGAGIVVALNNLLS
jgi:hypothetical protein